MVLLDLLLRFTSENLAIESQFVPWQWYIYRIFTTNKLYAWKRYSKDQLISKRQGSQSLLRRTERESLLLLVRIFRGANTYAWRGLAHIKDWFGTNPGFDYAKAKAVDCQKVILDSVPFQAAQVPTTHNRRRPDRSQLWNHTESFGRHTIRKPFKGKSFPSRLVSGKIDTQLTLYINC